MCWPGCIHVVAVAQVWKVDADEDIEKHTVSGKLAADWLRSLLCKDAEIALKRDLMSKVEEAATNFYHDIWQTIQLITNRWPHLDVAIQPISHRAKGDCI